MAETKEERANRMAAMRAAKADKAADKAKQTGSAPVFDFEFPRGAVFISKYRNYIWTLKPQRTTHDQFGNPNVDTGISVKFDEGIATVDDPETIFQMISDKARFGVDFCIDASDRTGYWKAFKEAHPTEVLKQWFPMGEPAGLNAQMAANVATILAETQGGRGTSVKITIERGNAPVRDGGRERLSAEQEAKLAAIQNA